MAEQISDLEKWEKLRLFLIDELKNFASCLENDGLPKREINISLTLFAAMYMGRSNEVREYYKRLNEGSAKELEKAVDLEPIFDKLILVAREGRVEKGMVIYQLLVFAFKLLDPDWKKVLEVVEKYRR